MQKWALLYTLRKGTICTDVSSPFKKKDETYRMANAIETHRNYAIRPRKKAGQSVLLGEKLPVLLTREVLQEYFKMPLRVAAIELVRAFNLDEFDCLLIIFAYDWQGICATAIKKVCRWVLYSPKSMIKDCWLC